MTRVRSQHLHILCLPNGYSVRVSLTFAHVYLHFGAGIRRSCDEHRGWSSSDWKEMGVSRCALVLVCANQPFSHCVCLCVLTVGLRIHIYPEKLSYPDDYHLLP